MPSHELETAKQLDDVQQRLDALEQLLAGQQIRITQQDDEIARLRAVLAEADRASAEAKYDQPPLILPASASAHANASHLRRDRATSRRTLLKVGGVAAAAGVAAVAAGAVEGSRGAQAAPNLPATGVAWQTGPVNADTQTLVQQGGSWDNSNQLLQLKLGSGAVSNPASLKAALAAYDTTGNQVGVYATSATGYGLFGVTDSGSGATGAGMNGTSTGTGTGVSGSSQKGIGVQGNSTGGIGGSFSGGQAPLALGLAGGPGAPTSGVHVAGEIFADSAAVLWVCNRSGDFGGSTHPVFNPLSSLILLPAPIRILDTRPGSGAPIDPGHPLANGSTTLIQVTGTAVGGVSVPAGAKAVLGNLTVTNTQGSGGLILWPAGAPRPLASNINWTTAGQTLANFAVIALSAGGAMDIYVFGSSASSDAIFDVAGYVL